LILNFDKNEKSAKGLKLKEHELYYVYNRKSEEGWVMGLRVMGLWEGSLSMTWLCHMIRVMKPKSKGKMKVEQARI
jgi:hypothetical protein